MRFLPVFMIVSALFFGAVFHPAYAQDAVAVRGGDHDGYSRLVFEWPAKTNYTVSKEGNRILVRFGKTGTLNINGVDGSARNVGKVDVISGTGEPLQVGIAIPDGSRFRDFTVQNKVILDIYDSKTGASAAKQSSVQPVAKTPEPVKAPVAPATVESAPAVPVKGVEATPPASAVLAPHTITMTSTKAFGLAVFERSGFLWIVSDNPGANVTPAIIGPQNSLFGDIQKIDVPSASAWRIDLPQGVSAAAEGAGLGWKITLSPKPAIPKTTNVSQQEGRLTWPLRDLRKEISFTDPLIGDQIRVITSPKAEESAGANKSFVEVDQLNSLVGLAFLPKTEGITAKIGPSNVVLSKEGGMIVSGVVSPAGSEKAVAAPVEAKPEENPAGETQEPVAEPAQTETDEMVPSEDSHSELSKPIATPEDLNKAATEKPSGNNIYNFPRWEMGGIKALGDNMHAIMLEAAGKDEQTRAEDIITLAKLNIANDRAPEALGLLRIAQTLVPELEGNIEFKALQGAGAALAGKYDVAFNHYNDALLQKYDDIKYWRAYTLAGLEDWKQAIDILPKNFDLIATYPPAIRTPLLLVFAEIALRGGNVPLTDSILSILSPDKAKFAKSYQAAMDYLAGESQRQQGNDKKAEELWKPLFDKGKDNLYRAKAGLSLTKLQLDRKEIKALEAINRLEGLRYAWRGDELETLINFRLGQMYVENKDYLKGLTILRNAQEITTSNNLSGMINDYMRKAYQDVFTNNHLKEISPLQAISLHEEFKDLTPAGDDGDRYVETLAERLVEANLLGRAATLLEYQVNNRLKGDRKAEIAIRLAAVRLLDGNPDGALRSLEIAQDALSKIEPASGEKPDAEKKEGEPAAQPEKPLTTDSEKQRQIDLLRARALSMNKKTDEAMLILEKMRLDPDVNRLRADIAWGAGKWEEAAVALNDLLLEEDISPRRPLTDYQRDLVLNRGIALNLSGNRVALANLRERYNAQMKATPKGSLFEIVSRPRRPDMVGSRAAIESMISELSLFQGFVDANGKVNIDKKEEQPLTPPAQPANTGDTKASGETPAANAKSQ